MAEVGADIWVLTECFTNRSPGEGFSGVFSPPHPDRRPDPEERWASVWSRYPLRRMDDPAPYRRGSLAAWVETPSGPLIVYGCVIAYAHEPTHDDGRSAKAWEVHALEVDRQRAEWLRLREVHPNVPLVVAGDFNQGRSGRRWSYGTNATRQAVSEGLGAAGMTCLTEVDLVEAGVISEPSHVEHICATTDLRLVGPVHAWRRTDEEGRPLSDHPTIAVDLARDDLAS